MSNESCSKELQRRETRSEKRRSARACASVKDGDVVPVPIESPVTLPPTERVTSKKIALEKSFKHSVEDDRLFHEDLGISVGSKHTKIAEVEVEISDDDFVDYGKKLRFKIERQ